nr:UDP-N-acetylmuramate dehydrogenase [Spirochaetota bacterium]
ITMRRDLIQKNIDLKQFTTFKIGGKAEYYSAPKDIEEVKYSLNFAKDKGLEVIIIGGGSNLLISDDGVEGAVIHTAALNKSKIDGVILTVESGLTVKNLNDLALSRSLSGLEFSGGLPGSIGGACYMNARSYNGEFADVVKEATVVDEFGTASVVDKTFLNYSYKYSALMDLNYFIYDVKLELKKGDPSVIKEIYLKNFNDRKSKGQFDYPSAGCVFKNNYQIGVSSGKIIEEAGLKGRVVGGAKVSEKHANFLINNGDAKAADVMKLIKFIEDEVLEKKGVKLERELRIIGFE